MFSMDKSSIRSTAKRTVHLQINLLGLQQMQLLKFNIKFSQVPISAKIILQKLLGSKMTLQTYSSIRKPGDLEHKVRSGKRTTKEKYFAYLGILL